LQLVEAQIGVEPRAGALRIAGVGGIGRGEIALEGNPFRLDLE